MILSREKSDNVDQTFFEKGIDNSDVDSLDVERVQSWFDIEDISEDRDIKFYWVKEPFVFVGIEYDSNGYDSNRDEYNVFEPTVSEEEEEMVGSIKENILTSEDKSISQYIDEINKSIESTFGSNINHDLDPYKMAYLIIKQGSNRGDLYPLFMDTNVIDFTVQEEDSVIVATKEPNSRDVVTNVSLEPDHLESICSALSEFAEYKSDDIQTGYIGSNLKFTISKTSSGRVLNVEFYDLLSASITELLAIDMMNSKMATYIWMAVESGQNIIISGASGSGKTTLIQCMLDFMPQQSRVLAVGDGKELAGSKNNIQHYSWDSFDTERDLKMVSNTLPKYMIFDNITDGLGSKIVFNSVSQGKTVWTTLNGGDLNATLNRLTNPPINKSEVQIPHFDIMIQLNNLAIKASNENRFTPIKRVSNISEIEFASPDGFHIDDIYDRDQFTDEFVETSKGSRVFNDFHHTSTSKEVMDEVEQRTNLLEEMTAHGIYEKSKVRAIIIEYRTNKDWFEEKLEDEEIDIEEVFNEIVEQNGLD